MLIRKSPNTRTFQQVRQHRKQDSKEEWWEDTLDDTRNRRWRVLDPAEPSRRQGNSTTVRGKSRKKDVRNFLAESRDVTEGTNECDGDKPDDDQRETA